MKKTFVTGLCLLTLASCNVKNSDEYKALKSERDALVIENTQSSAEITEMMEIVNDVEDNFKQIKEAEKYLAVEAKNKNEIMSRDTKTRVRDNFEMINEILLKNKEQINTLNQKLKSSSTNAVGLKKTIELLTAQLEEKTNTIKELQQALVLRDKQIAELQSNMEVLSAGIDNLATKTQEQAAALKAKEDELNRAYYMFGTSGELKDAQVVSGGFLSSLKVKKDNIDKTKFLQIDIRTESVIHVYAKKAKLLSDHPKGSYTIEKDKDGLATINIKDYKSFWSLTRYLIVEV